MQCLIHRCLHKGRRKKTLWSFGEGDSGVHDLTPVWVHLDRSLKARALSGTVAQRCAATFVPLRDPVCACLKTMGSRLPRTTIDREAWMLVRSHDGGRTPATRTRAMVTFSMPTPSVASSARQTGRASAADEGPEKSAIPGRGLACLTAHEPSSTVPLDDKGRLIPTCTPIAWALAALTAGAASARWRAPCRQ